MSLIKECGFYLTQIQTKIQQLSIGESVTKVVKISIGNLSADACDKCKEELFKNM